MVLPDLEERKVKRDRYVFKSHKLFPDPGRYIRAETGIGGKSRADLGHAMFLYMQTDLRSWRALLFPGSSGQLLN